MSFGVEIDYDTADRITLENLCDTYETLYREMVLGKLHPADKFHYDAVLNAADIMIKWYDIPSVAEERIRKIKQSVQDEIILEKYEMKLKSLGDTND